MAICRGLKKNIEDSRLDAVIGICKNPYPLCYLVCHLKAHSRNVVSQAIGILLDDAVEGRAILLIYSSRQVHGNSIALQKHHGLTHILLFLHLPGDIHGHLLADALNLRKAFRLLLHNAEGISLKMTDNPSS